MSTHDSTPHTPFELASSAVCFHLDHMTPADLRSALIYLSGRNETEFAQSVLHARGIGNQDGAWDESIAYLNREAANAKGL
jgi:hypothetical protein